MHNVLIIDDQTTSLKIMAKLVTTIDPQARFFSFTDSVAALDWAKHNDCDLVIADLRMPVMNGIELTRWFRRLPGREDVPLIMVTIVEDRQARYSALEAGATDFLTKPLDHIEFRARCRNLLKLREQQQIIKDRSRWLEQQVADAVRGIEQREHDSLLHLAKAGEYRDTHTGGHVQRMARYCRIIADAMGLPAEFRQTIELAAPLHDIGKIGIPDSILLKPGPLTTAERKIINRHTEIGYDILKDSPSKYLQMGAIVARYHHEHFDGNGYPFGLASQDIPLEARIAAIADVFDALRSSRPYKTDWSLQDTLEYIRRRAGAQFDPECVDAFMSRIDAILEIQAIYTDLKLVHQK